MSTGYKQAPPLTSKCCPLTNDERSLTKNSATLPTSSIVASRFTGFVSMSIHSDECPCVRNTASRRGAGYDGIRRDTPVANLSSPYIDQVARANFAAAIDRYTALRVRRCAGGHVAKCSCFSCCLMNRTKVFTNSAVAHVNSLVSLVKNEGGSGGSNHFLRS